MNATTGEFVWTPQYDETGHWAFNLSVTDGNTTATQAVTLTVLYANTPPVFVTQASQQVYDGQSLGFQVFAYDPNNPNYAPPIQNADGSVTQQNNFPATIAVTLASPLPAGATFNPQTLEFTWTPTFSQAGVTNVSFLATQIAGFSGPALTSMVTIPITVLPLVLPPVIAPVSDVTVATGSTDSFTVSATDPQGRALTLSLVNDAQGSTLPPFISLMDNGNGTGTITIAPGAGRPQHHDGRPARDLGGGRERGRRCSSIRRRSSSSVTSAARAAGARRRSATSWHAPASDGARCRSRPATPDQNCR